MAGPAAHPAHRQFPARAVGVWSGGRGVNYLAPPSDSESGGEAWGDFGGGMEPPWRAAGRRWGTGTGPSGPAAGSLRVGGFAQRSGVPPLPTADPPLRLFMHARRRRPRARTSSSPPPPARPAHHPACRRRHGCGEGASRGTCGSRALCVGHVPQLSRALMRLQYTPRPPPPLPSTSPLVRALRLAASREG